MSIVGNMAGCYSPMGKTFVISDENGNEVTGVVTEQEQIFTATDNQVYSGYTYAGDSGVSTGTREFISYRTTKGKKVIQPGKSFSIPLTAYDMYNFTEIQCIITPYNTSVANSVAADKVVIGSSVYAVGTATKLGDVASNAETKSIDLNITNDSSQNYIIHYFTYKEEEI